MDVRPQRPRQYFDVAAPGRMPQPATSRPVVTGRPIVTDPMFRRPSAPAPAAPSAPMVKPAVPPPPPPQPRLPQQPAQAAPVSAQPAPVSRGALDMITPRPLEPAAPIPPRPPQPPAPSVAISQEDQALLGELPVDLPKTDTPDSGHSLDAHTSIAKSRKRRPFQWAVLIILGLAALALVTLLAYFAAGFFGWSGTETIVEKQATFVTQA